MKNEIIKKIEYIFNSCSLKLINDKYDNQQLSLEINKNKITDFANLVKEFNGRCITINAYKEKGIHTLLYVFDIKNILINVNIFLKEKHIQSITSFLKSTIWMEEKINQQHNIEFLGHLNMKKVFVDKSSLDEYIPLSEVMTSRY